MFQRVSLLPLLSLLGIALFLSLSFGDQVLLASDFRNFWSAALFARHGGNPYNWEASRSFMAQADPRIEDVAMILPPWTLILPALLTFFDYLLAAKVWIFLNVLAAYGLARSVQPSLVNRGERPSYPYAAFVFPPVLFALYSGHYPILLAWCASTGINLIRTQRFFLAGVVLSALLCKPHVFVPLGVMGIFWMLRERQIRLLAGGVAGLVGMVFLTLAVSPTLFSDWVHSTPIWGDFGQNKTETTSTLVRLLCWDLSGRLPDWPLWALPLSTFLCTLWYLFRSRDAFHWAHAFPRALALGVIGMPYGWFYDGACLLVLFLYVCDHLVLGRSSAERMKHMTAVAALILFPLIKVSPAVNHFLYSIYPSILAVVFLRYQQSRALGRGSQ